MLASNHGCCEQVDEKQDAKTYPVTLEHILKMFQEVMEKLTTENQ